VRVCVTGATGFVGAHLTKALCERGDDVVCLVRDLDRAKKTLGEPEPRLVLGGLSDRKALESACEDVDVIFHSAGLTTALNRDGFFAVNARATAALAEAAKEAAPNLQRFVYVSSQAAAGPSTKGRPKTELDPAVAVSNYGASKFAGEEAICESGLPYTVVRPCAVYGPGDKAFLSVFKLLRFGFMPTFSSPEQELSMIHVDDLVRALLGVVVPDTESETFFACHPETVSARMLCNAIRAAVAPGAKRGPLVFGLPAGFTRALLAVTGTAARMVGQSTFLSRDKGNEYLAEAWLCSPAKLEAATGWAPQIPIAQGVKSTADWYRENGWL